VKWICIVPIYWEGYRTACIDYRVT